MTETYKIKIDQLPEEPLEADSPADAARKVAALIASNEHLKRLDDGEPVEIKRPDGRPWGRNLTLGAFREARVVADDDDPDGPIHPPSP